MKHIITDALQIVVALLITSGIIASAAPLPTKQTTVTPVKQTVQTVKAPEKPVQAPVAPVVPEKVVTWQDNPNHCTDAQWIAEGAPFGCIDKPVAPAPVAVAARPAVQAVPQVAASVGYCGDNMYKQYIYSHESGCNTDRYNSIGCYGIGQSCPKSKIAHCGADFACQDAWFSNYAEQRYGGWAGAYQFWLQNHWW